MLAVIAVIIKGPEIVDHFADAIERLGGLEKAGHQAKKHIVKVGERAKVHAQALRLSHARRREMAADGKAEKASKK